MVRMHTWEADNNQDHAKTSTVDHNIEAPKPSVAHVNDAKIVTLEDSKASELATSVNNRTNFERRPSQSAVIIELENRQNRSLIQSASQVLDQTYLAKSSSARRRRTCDEHCVDPGN